MGQGRPSTRGNNARRELSLNEISSPSEVKQVLPPSTTMGENNIPVTDSTSKKEVSNLITNNPFVPVKTDYDYSQASRPRGNERGKFKFKLPKLKFSGSGKRTAMRGKSAYQANRSRPRPKNK